MSQRKKKDYSQYYSNDSLSYYKRILDGTITKLPEEEIESSGFVVSTLEASIWSLYNSNNYEEAVLKAVNLGADTDTVAAITGSLAGAYYGNIPNKWLSKIQNKNLIDDIYNNFINNIKEKGTSIKK